MDLPEARTELSQRNERPRHGRWVVGVDGSECSRHAALWAAAQAPGRTNELELATSWSIPVSTAMTPMGPLLTGASFDALESSAHATVDDLARSIGPSLDVPVTRSVGRGGAASLLLEAAHRSDLLVVGSRGRGGFARLVLGSTSTQCATHSSAPVAVVPAASPIAPVAPIVVAFDGSANSIAALEWANEFAATGATIDCVSVWDTSPIAAGADQFFFPEAGGLAEQHLEHLVMRTIRPVRREDVEIRHTFVNGQPRTILSEFAKSADLLVMGARGCGVLGAAVLGSVSTWLLHHTGQPMVVVPNPTEDVVDDDGDGPDRED